jgi:hypothetical protein
MLFDVKQEMLFHVKQNWFERTQIGSRNKKGGSVAALLIKIIR